ncbi:hypothetical protein A1Q2_02430 [Trichosporon asahii var. asahii CBS 8904]|uniref:Uncharacterized protein n=1 Tax=Trichosporon asahii var. asahii (strain CBS 8904) TaxID=1220162 RepID=K1VGT2_TRIAC|nr:hypothetical protein A1Q2_02430 [Trichosporon asahii var. asahii CBS 8904]
MSYTIAGRAIKSFPRRPAPSPVIKLIRSALGTIFSTIGIALASSGGDKKEQAAPPAAKDDTSINTGNKEEDDFIRQFVAAAEEKGDDGKH